MFCGCFEGLAGIHRCSDVAVMETFRNEWIDKTQCLSFPFFILFCKQIYINIYLCIYGISFSSNKHVMRFLLK